MHMPSVKLQLESLVLLHFMNYDQERTHLSQLKQQQLSTNLQLGAVFVMRPRRHFLETTTRTTTSNVLLCHCKLFIHHYDKSGPCPLMELSPGRLDMTEFILGSLIGLLVSRAIMHQAQQPWRYIDADTQLRAFPP